MATRASRAVTRVVLTCLIASIAALAGIPGVARTATVMQGRSVPTTTNTLEPGILDPSAGDLPGNLRGLYRRLGDPSPPSGVRTNDVYVRELVSWGRIERVRGVYDFTQLDALMQQAGSSRGSAGLRVMAFCPGCAMPIGSSADAQAPLGALPAWLPRQAGVATPVPDWNSEGFLSAWEQLMALLGQRYGSDPRLGFVDIGGYGRAGSWRIDPATDGAPITDANRKRLVAAVATAFPRTWILINTSTDVPFTRWVLDTYPHAGLRTDNLGVPNMASSLPVSPELQNYWTTRPIFSAWAPTADGILGATQVRQWHVSTVGPRDTSTMTDAQRAAFDTAVKTAGYRFVVVQAVVPRLSRGATASISVRLRNDGSAPIYQARTLTLQLRSGAGTIAASTPSTIDMRRILPGTANVVAPLKVPVTVAKGTYDLTLIATDPSGYAPPLGFANTTFTADGAVVLGSVSVP